MKFFARTICSAALIALAAPLSAQEQNPEPEEQTSQPDDSTIVVTGDAADDSGESVRQRVLRVGRKITRPARSGRPVSRFEDPICVMVSGMPEDASALIKGRIEDNARSLRGVRSMTIPTTRQTPSSGFSTM
ncbi:hypothetical protein [Erythrobacter rubeus]|uniref:Uncharacterized protein n=1 Tax=Erythrobacter rubeus TaxID=2760803 RepID=A0ABR8KPY2_9SPHN|nr:hypothetical protein [Erythrobacter rubeus]MBD2841355.1 hypothetical protein [Erythrobacter rubeus]